MYNIVIYLFLIGVAVASLFDKKVRKMWRGERAAFDTLRRQVDPGAQYVWFHAASLGEFEQGRLLIESIRERRPEYKILLTFFSPSGYEVRKDYAGADIVVYLPVDTPTNAARFLDAVRPVMAFFIKYEFWYNYLHILKRRGVPVYSVSSIFREGQIFFKWYARSYTKVLRCFTHFYVQDETSARLLATLGITDVTVTGDTRADRVLSIKEQSSPLPLVAAFTQGRQVFIAGSSWGPDEDIFIPFFNEHPDWRMIIAPHVISDEHLAQIESKVRGRVVRYTTATGAAVRDADCLLIDCFGLLSSIYRYADVAYIGGGFGDGIHNTLEAAVWDVPVFFGPNNKKFMEARGLQTAKGGFEITGYDDFRAAMQAFIADVSWMQEAGRNAGDYVRSHAGATGTIIAGVLGGQATDNRQKT